MKIYLDVSCLNRPFDDQGQERVRFEAYATSLIIERCEQGDWQHVSSDMATIELNAMADTKRRARVRQLLPTKALTLELTEDVYSRAEVLQELGFKAADAVHVAAAEAIQADVFLSCDDRLVRLAKRCEDKLMVRVANPLTWVKEVDREPNA